MSYQKVSDETEKLFKDRIVTKHLDGLSWGVISDDTLKMSKDKMCGKTIVNNQIVRERYDEDVLFIINEPVFDRLSEKHQIIMVDKLIAYIEYNLDTDKIKKRTPDVQEFSGVLMQYQWSELEILSSEISRVYQEIKEENTRSDGKEEK